MGLFFEVLEVLNHRDLRGNVGQLETVILAIERIGKEQGIAPEMMPKLVSVLGGLLRSHLLQHPNGLEGTPLETLLDQSVDSTGRAAALQRLLPEPIQSQMLQALVEQTGVPIGRLQTLLPVLLPALLGLLAMGLPTTNPKMNSKTETAGQNPILKAFLEGDRPEAVDLGVLFQAGVRFLAMGRAIAPPASTPIINLRPR